MRRRLSEQTRFATPGRRPASRDGIVARHRPALRPSRDDKVDDTRIYTMRPNAAKSPYPLMPDLADPLKARQTPPLFLPPSPDSPNFEIGGMSPCASCALRVEKALAKGPGVTRVGGLSPPSRARVEQRRFRRARNARRSACVRRGYEATPICPPPLSPRLSGARDGTGHQWDDSARHARCASRRHSAKVPGCYACVGESRHRACARRKEAFVVASSARGRRAQSRL